jgi:hypothetical protein
MRSGIIGAEHLIPATAYYFITTYYNCTKWSPVAMLHTFAGQIYCDGHEVFFPFSYHNDIIVFPNLLKITHQILDG